MLLNFDLTFDSGPWVLSRLATLEGNYYPASAIFRLKYLRVASFRDRSGAQPVEVVRLDGLGRLPHTARA